MESKVKTSSVLGSAIDGLKTTIWLPLKPKTCNPLGSAIDGLKVVIWLESKPKFCKLLGSAIDGLKVVIWFCWILRYCKLLGNGIDGLKLTISFWSRYISVKELSNPPILFTSVIPIFSSDKLTTPSTSIIACNLPDVKSKYVILTLVAPAPIKKDSKTDWSVTPKSTQSAVTSKLVSGSADKGIKTLLTPDTAFPDTELLKSCILFTTLGIFTIK